MTGIPSLIGPPTGAYQIKKQNEEVRDATRAIQKSQSELESGRAVNTLTDAKDKSYSLLNLMETEKEQLSDHINLKTSIDRLGRSNPILTKIHDEFSAFKDRIVAMRSQNGFADPTFQKDAANLLTTIGHLLNSRDHENRFLFGGNKTGFQQTDITDPNSINVVDITRIPTPGVGAPPSNAYYLGTNDIAAVQLTNGHTESYGVVASNPCFAQILHALKIGATTPPDNNPGSVNYQKLTNALDIGKQGQEGLNILKSQSEANEANLTKILEFIDDDRSVLENSIADIIDQDPVAAFVKGKTLQEKLKIIHQLVLMNLTNDREIAEAYSQMAR